jgi:transcriptional regulator with XRE-family HTH domain
MGVCIGCCWWDYAHVRVHVNGFFMQSELGISDRLREERERLGFTQASLADKLSVSRNTQVNYERGDRIPDATYLAAFAACGADVMWVLTGMRPLMATEAAPPAISRRGRTLLENYLACDEDGQKAIERMATLEAQSKSLKKAG